VTQGKRSTREKQESEGVANTGRAVRAQPCRRTQTGVGELAWGMTGVGSRCGSWPPGTRHERTIRDASVWCAALLPGVCGRRRGRGDKIASTPHHPPRLLTTALTCGASRGVGWAVGRGGEAGNASRDVAFLTHSRANRPVDARQNPPAASPYPPPTHHAPCQTRPARLTAPHRNVAYKRPHRATAPPRWTNRSTCNPSQAHTQPQRARGRSGTGNVNSARSRPVGGGTALNGTGAPTLSGTAAENAT